MLDLLQRGIGMLVEKSFAGNNESGRAETALLSIIVNKSLLHRMQMARLPQTFHRGDGPGLRVNGENGAGINCLAVHHYSAGAARPAITDAFGSRQLELVAQGVQQRDPWLQLSVIG